MTDQNDSRIAALIEEAIWATREKEVRSTTLERLRLTREADRLVEGRSQPRQLAEGLFHLLDNVSLPVSSNDFLLGRILEEVPDDEGEQFFSDTVKGWGGRGIPPWMPDGGHECFDWARLLRLGLAGLEAFAEDAREQRAAAGGPDAEVEWLASAARVYQAFRNYARRYAAAAREAGQPEAAARCAPLAERPPQTFAEGLQLIWLVAQVYCTMLAPNPTLTMGRIDQLLLEAYRSDLAAGRLTRTEAGQLIADFYAKNSIILGRGEHQMSGGDEKATGWARNLTYDAPQYVFLGGRRSDSSSSTNELTELFLERVVPAFENPVIVFRYCRDTPEHIWRIACEKMRANASFMVYNDEVVIPAFRHAGVPESEAVEYSMYGCNWPITSGRSRTVVHRRPLLPAHFLNAFVGRDGDTPRLASIDELYERFAESLRKELEEVREEYVNWRKSAEANAPGPLRVDDCFLDGPVARARSWALGGTPTSTVTLGIAGTATTADSFAAVDDLVFASGAVGLETLQEAVRQDFAGHDDLLRRCRRAPKFGRDDDRADAHASRLMGLVTSEVDRVSSQNPANPICVFRSLTTDMQHRRFGGQLGATPDGRGAGEPVSENSSPCVGACTDGLTSMFRSLAKLPFDRINSGPLNVRISPRLVEGEQGLTNLAAMLRTYFDLGGQQVQLSFVDTEQLREAQRDPEAHRDLLVRITGYSAVFVDMSRAAQEEIIRREEMCG